MRYAWAAVRSRTSSCAAQQLTINHEPGWVFMVDTHDGFSTNHRFPPANHPDAQAWLILQNNNRILKEKIEAGFEQEGIATMNSVLRRDLQG